MTPSIIAQRLDAVSPFLSLVNDPSTREEMNFALVTLYANTQRLVGTEIEIEAVPQVDPEVRAASISEALLRVSKIRDEQAQQSVEQIGQSVREFALGVQMVGAPIRVTSSGAILARVS